MIITIISIDSISYNLPDGGLFTERYEFSQQFVTAAAIHIIISCSSSSSSTTTIIIGDKTADGGI